MNPPQVYMCSPSWTLLLIFDIQQNDLKCINVKVLCFGSGERWLRGRAQKNKERVNKAFFFFFFFLSDLVYCLFFETLSSIWKLIILNIYSWMREWVNWKWLLKKQHLDMKNPESEVAQSCPTLCNSMDCSAPGPLVQGIFHARILEWVAIPFSRRPSRPRDWTQVSHIVGRCLTVWATKEAL